MKQFCSVGVPNLFSPRSSTGMLILLAFAHAALQIHGQSGVSLKFQGVTIPGDSLVDIDDILYTAPSPPEFNVIPSNSRQDLHNGSLLCETDLVDCCDSPRTMRGDWYYPDGTVVQFDAGGRFTPTFRANRGPNDGGQFYGSVRLFRRYTPLQRGRFRCELPNATHPNDTQILYANIVNFGERHTVDHVIISSSDPSTIAGETYSLNCSATLHPDSSPLPATVTIKPTFIWFFGPNGRGSLPSGVTLSETTTSDNITFTSILEFPQLSQSVHTGNYTCRLGPGRLTNSFTIDSVNAPDIAVRVTPSGSTMLGQNGYSITCDVSGVANLSSSITYQWTKKNGTQTQIQVGLDVNIVSFSPLQLSDAGNYTCQVNVSSSYLSSVISVSSSRDISIEIPAPNSTRISSNIPNPIPPFGSDVTLTCAVELTSRPEIDIPLNVTFELLRTDPLGPALPTTPPSVSGSTYTTTAVIRSFGRSNSGVYTCRANFVPLTTSTFINDSITGSDTLRVTTGVYLTQGGESYYDNNSNINIRNIGESSDNPSNALQCVTDKDPCCLNQNPRHGEWYLPNGTLVQETTSTIAFYRNRGDNGEVYLNRPSDVMTPTGLFCCQVPDATDTNQTLCVNIGGLSITASGTLVAGESYTLECSTGGSMGMLQWLGPPDGRTQVNSTNSIMINSTSTSSQLQFRPVKQKHNGSYSCRATVDGQSLMTNLIDVTVDAPTVSVQITDGGVIPSAEKDYRLVCNVTGAENLNSNMTYRWTKNTSSVGMNSNTLSFSPLRLSEAASYSCEVTVSSDYLTRSIVAVNVNPQDIRIQIPTPSTVTMTSNLNSGVIVGSEVRLTCTVRLNQAIVQSDLSLLTVTAQLLSQDRAPPTLSGPSMTDTTFIYTTQLNSFRRNDSGNYTCDVTVGPQSTATFLNGTETLNHTIEITTGVYISLNDQVYMNNSFVVTGDIGVKEEVESMGGERKGEALLCYTDNTRCCQDTSMNIGHWFKAGGSAIGNESESGEFYVSRGLGVVRLHRRNTSSPTTGVFCCEVPDARSRSTRICADLVLQLPTTPPISNTDTKVGPMNSLPTIAGSAVAGLALVIILVVIIIVVIVFMRRRRSSKPYQVTKGSSHSVLYSKQSNGDQLLGIGMNKEPEITEYPSDTNITEGEGVHLKIKISGVPQPTVTWYHDGEPVETDYAREIESDGSLAIPSAELKHSGVYKAVAANDNGSDEKELKLTVSEEGAESKTDSGETVKSRPIPISEFGKYVSELHSNSNKPFKDLYEALDIGEATHGTSYATDPKRKPLNRFGNIVVYDDNRITLHPLPEAKDCQEDYINACYIDGYSVANKFIATQGPIPKTVVDFWRLIWQEHPPTIVMVTNLKEGNRIKCQKYWPDSGQENFGPFQVIITDQQVYADYTVRTLSVSLGSGRSHKVTQYHFTAWPDHGVPDYATSILAFHKRVKAQHRPSRGPMVVHCSAGVGRTGTFIVMDNILEQIEKEQIVDIPGAITKIRQRRMKMVQTHEQFTFIHDAILESVTCGDTQIAATNLRTAITTLSRKDGFQHQMNVLGQVSPNPDEVQCNSARNHPDRNRGNLFLPADRWRVTLKGDQPDYIHAVNINGYKHQRAFIIAQGPMQSTVRNFWKMVYERKSAVIVMVSDLVEGGQEASAQYWPGNGLAQYGEYTVDLLGEEPLQGFTIRTISVMDKKTQKAHQVTQFHITCWSPDGHCSNLKSVTDVIEEMTKVQIRSGNKPIVVHCSDTVTRSGMFCAIATTIERCKTEGVVDVFQVVKALRVQKPGAVPTVDQYRQIFETVLVFLESFDTYANFQM